MEHGSTSSSPKEVKEIQNSAWQAGHTNLRCAASRRHDAPSAARFTKTSLAGGGRQAEPPRRSANPSTGHGELWAYKTGPPLGPGDAFRALEAHRILTAR